MARGTLSKHCSCTDHTGRKLGARCPRLRRSPGGSWHPTHGVWAYQLELPTTPEGRRAQLRRSGFGTREQAQTELDHAKQLLELAAGDPQAAQEITGLIKACTPGSPLPDRDQLTRRMRSPINGVPTFGQYLHKWVAGRGHVAANTMRCYRDHIRLYLEPHLGHIRLDQLNVADFETMFAAITERDNRTLAARNSPDPAVRASVRGVQTMSPASRQRLRATARKALNDAIRTHHRGLLAFNPAAYLELPSGKPPKPRVWTPKAVQTWKATGKRPSRVMVWTPDQAGAFLDHAETHDIALYPLFVLITHRGLRRGEAIGLREVDVDLDTGEVTITQQITPVNYTPITTSLKTDAGQRTIPLDQITTRALRDYQQRKTRWRKTSGRSWPASGLWFTTPTGHPWHPSMVSHRFTDLVTSSGLPPVRLHDLRHCAATYLRAAGADLKTIQETLGHAQLNITADTYTSVLTELERATAETAAGLVPRHQHTTTTRRAPARRR